LEALVRRITSLAVPLLVALLALGSVPFGVGAQTASPTADGQAFVGAWHLTSQSPSGPSQSFLTLADDGTVVFSPRPAAPAGQPPVVFISTGHGAWEQTGPTTAAASFSVFITDGDGNLMWVVTDSVEMTLGEDGTSWSGPYSSTTADPEGTVLGSAPGTAEATRLTLQPMAVPAAGPASSASPAAS
jgi:hypothetical protein